MVEDLTEESLGNQCLAICGSANWDMNESADSFLARANGSYLVNIKTMQVSGRSRSQLIANRCGIHVRVCGQRLV